MIDWMPECFQDGDDNDDDNNDDDDDDDDYFCHLYFIKYRL